MDTPELCCRLRLASSQIESASPIIKSMSLCIIGGVSPVAHLQQVHSNCCCCMQLSGMHGSSKASVAHKEADEVRAGFL